MPRESKAPAKPRTENVTARQEWHPREIQGAFSPPEKFSLRPQQRLHHRPMDIRQTVVAALEPVGQTGVIESQGT